MSRCALFLLPLFGSVILTACAAPPTNPSFKVSYNEARQAAREMQADPRPLQRPLVIVGGFLDPSVSGPLFKSWFGNVTRDSKMIVVSLCFCGSFEECREKVIAAVDAACPTIDPQRTVDVDVVGASLGGLVARYAAAPSTDPAHPRRLAIARLFSISSPHAGATLADSLGFTDYHRDMRGGSDFLQRLALADNVASYELYPYVLLHDEIVGARYAAPPGSNPLWLAGPNFVPPHAAAMADPRILADIARRLRGETPFTHLPATPLPPAS